MAVAGKIGTAAHARTTHAWAPTALACMGVVFGDIGTSPLYTLGVAAKAASPTGTVAPDAVLGIVSLIFWSLIVVISIKYATLIMRADNHGEGGILALLALISPRRAKQSRQRAIMIVIGLIGACLLYGDGAITPAISVLSAIEGIKVYAPQLDRAVVPLTVVILVVLFIIQSKGTSWIGASYAGLVRCDWGTRHCRDCALTRGARRFESYTGDHLSVAWQSARFCSGWCGFPGSHRRRGNVR